MDTVFIDGAAGEGGGQLLRTALTLSCITAKNLHIENIRAARRNPGLAKQHLSCVKAACRISSAKSHGAVLNSKVLDFQPGTLQAGDFNFNVGSAGSATLVAQTILPALFLAEKPSTITITGGTHNPLAPPFDFIHETFLPAIAAAGFHADCKLLKHGFYPAGGGKITLHIQPAKKHPLQPINLCKPSEQPKINARIYTAKLPAHIAQRQKKLLLESPLQFTNIEHIEAADSDGPGNCIMIRICSGSRTTVFTAFGIRGKPSADVVNEVVTLAKNFLASSAIVDRFLADQILIYMAIAKNGSYTTNELSNHLLTNIEIIKKFLPVSFRIVRQEKTYTISRVPENPPSWPRSRGSNPK